ncbi:MAG TPA: hydroxymethylglutaryl-CoA synthase [Myxococcota bacterium]|nr:hydroxymethylglutaryl-CoA synthase [Myxococcota bacterium]HRY93237.1 hydroxymethylglutaryl-CoA synthase [Myxococcota bacterium]
MNSSLRFGLEALSVHIPRHHLEMGELARATGVDPQKYLQGLGVQSMAVAAPDEDPVTMACEAAGALLRDYRVDPACLGLLVVGSESGVDEAKPIATFVHGLLGLPPGCRTFDTKHACYGATAALRLALDWCEARGARAGKKALVVASDIARYEVGSAGEPTQGAGAVAMLVSDEPALLAVEPWPEAVFTQDVMDFWRPNYTACARVDGQVSIQCYLRALEHCWGDFERQSRLGFDDYEHMLFHVPFPKMAYKAFRALHEREAARRGGELPGLDALFAERTEPGLWVNRLVGNVYSGSLYLSLAGLLERGDRRVEGARVGLFSYGSGCCAEWFSARVGPDAGAWRGRVGIAEALRHRRALEHAEYLQFRALAEHLAQDDSCLEPLPGPSARPRPQYLGVRGDRRQYRAPARACAGQAAEADSALALAAGALR